MRRQGLTRAAGSPKEPLDLDDSNRGRPLDAAAAGGSNDTSAATQGDGVKKIKLLLRSKKFPQTKAFNFRATSTCQAILQHYLKNIGVDGDGGGKIKLTLDGEDLDPDSIIEDADIDADGEEGTLLDVVGI